MKISLFVNGVEIPNDVVLKADVERELVLDLFIRHYQTELEGIAASTSSSRTSDSHAKHAILLSKEKFRLEFLKHTLNPSAASVAFIEKQAGFFAGHTITTDIQQYVERGRMMFENRRYPDHLKYIIKIFKKIGKSDLSVEETDISKPPIHPFVIVCCSSGTGKTQLPFCLPAKYPVFYFLFSWT